MSLHIGSEVELSDGRWLVTDAHWRSYSIAGAPVGPVLLTLTRIPDGETAMGMGRTWEKEKQEKRTLTEQSENDA